MSTEDLEYSATYSAMEDEELLEVARDASDLLPEAKAVLGEELRKRGLKVEIAREEKKAAEESETEKGSGPAESSETAEHSKAPESSGAVYGSHAGQSARGSYHMKLEDFEAAVAETLDSIPQEFRERIQNVAVLVEDLPPQPIPTPPGQPRRILLGLFHGVPRTQKSVFSGPIGSPDYVVLYKKNIEGICSNEAEVREQIRLTVIHELGHYFGMTEEQLRGV